jgi:hypothetical protein
MASKFRFEAVAGRLTLRTHDDLAVRSDDLLARRAKLEQALAQQK